MFKRFLLVVLVFLLSISGICLAFAEDTQEGTIVTNTNEFLSALEDPTVTEIIFKTNITTKNELTIVKPIDLNGNNWFIDAKTVTLASNVTGGGKITVAKNATLLAYTVPSVAKTVNGTMRVMETFSVDCGSGTVDSVSYIGSSGKDTGSGIKGTVVSKGTVALMVKTNKSGEPKDVSYINIDGTKYKAGTKINAYSKTYKITLIITEDNKKTIEYTSLDVARTLSEATRAGYIFEGWLAEGSETPEKTVVIPEGTSGNMTFTAVWSEDPNAKSEEYPSWNGGKGRGGSSYFNKMGSGEEAALVDETGVVEETEEGQQEGEREATELETQGPSGNSSAPRGKRISVASSKTKTAFEEGAPKTEDVGVTIEADTEGRIRTIALGGGIVLVAIVLLILLGRSKRR